MEIDDLSHISGDLLSRELGKVCEELEAEASLWHTERGLNFAGLWTGFRRRNTASPRQGWKLHISAFAPSAVVVLRRVLPVLLKASAHFKVITSLQALIALNQGTYGWSQIGKFITVYPDSDQEALRLAVLLDEATKGLSGPTIPSDRPLYPGSLVYYRYGHFQDGPYIQERSGLIVATLRTPTGELVPDVRKIHYSVPDWCIDPFVASGIASTLPGVDKIINGRYLIARVVAVSPTHTVYLAADLKEPRSCILKAPGFIGNHRAAGDALNSSLRHEATILQQLAPIPSVPRLYECLVQDGTTFLVMEDIEGETLASYISNSVRKGQLVPLQQVIELGGQLAAILKAIHERGLVYEDLKPSNVIVGQGQKVYIVDFELACEQGSQDSEVRGTRGYISPQRSFGQPARVADDIYSFGALLYFMITALDPSHLPAPSSLQQRPPQWFHPEGALLGEIIDRCLRESLEERCASLDEVQAALNTLPASQPALLFEPCAFPHDEDQHNSRGSFLQISRDLLETINSIAQRRAGQHGVCWISTHRFSHGLIARDINAGNAGTVLALAELVAAHAGAEKRDLLIEACQWLQRAPFIRGQPLPGLYIGESGVGAALLRAGQVLHNSELIDAACQRGELVASMPYESPDVFNGTAGRLRFHLLLWDETGEQEQLRNATACGDFLLQKAVTQDGLETCWIIPQGYQSMSGQAFLGYAHGAAGIADALLDLFEVTGDERYLAVVQNAGRWLRRQVVVASDEQAVNWPRRENEQVTTPFWCHGGAGIGRFFLHLARHSPLAEAGDIAARAARSVACYTRWTNPTQCHGLAGSIEFLLDMYQATGQENYRKDACALARCLIAFAYKYEGRLVFPSEDPAIFTPDYMVGYAGTAMCLLRLSNPEHMPHQLSRHGFRFKPSIDVQSSSPSGNQKGDRRGVTTNRG